LILVALFGALIEFFNVAWVHYSERGDARRTGLTTVAIKGLDLWVVLNVVDTRALAAACVAGHAIGAALAVSAKTWWLRRAASNRDPESSAQAGSDPK